MQNLANLWHVLSFALTVTVCMLTVLFQHVSICCTFIVGPTLFFSACLRICPQNKRDVLVCIYIIYHTVFSVLARFGPIEERIITATTAVDKAKSYVETD